MRNATLWAVEVGLALVVRPNNNHLIARWTHKRLHEVFAVVASEPRLSLVCTRTAIAVGAALGFWFGGLCLRRSGPASSVSVYWVLVDRIRPMTRGAVWALVTELIAGRRPDE